MSFNEETLSFDVPDTDTVYVSDLPACTEKDLEEHFGAIGIIRDDKKRRCKKVWLYKDKATGEPKGDATVSYEDPFSAASAVKWFDGKEFKGKVIKVSLAEDKRGGGGGGGGGGSGWNNTGYDAGAGGSSYYDAAPPPPQFDAGGGGGFGGGGGGGRGGGGGGGRRAGDWVCSCGNENFAFRNSCRRCGGPRTDGGGSGGGGGGGGGGGSARPPSNAGAPGDWPCGSCGNVNFARRNECNRCRAPKPSGSGGGGGGGGGGGREREGGRGRGGGDDDDGRGRRRRSRSRSRSRERERRR